MCDYSDLLLEYQSLLACNKLIQLGGCTESAAENHVNVDFGIPEITPYLVDAASESIKSVCVVP